VNPHPDTALEAIPGRHRVMAPETPDKPERSLSAGLAAQERIDNSARIRYIFNDNKHVEEEKPWEASWMR
jgi:hypothetical protein